MELPFDLAIPLLGLYQKNPEILIQKNLSTQMFIAALFTIAKSWKQAKCLLVNEHEIYHSLEELWYIYTMAIFF